MFLISTGLMPSNVVLFAAVFDCKPTLSFCKLRVELWLSHVMVLTMVMLNTMFTLIAILHVVAVTCDVIFTRRNRAQNNFSLRRLVDFY